SSYSMLSGRRAVPGCGRAATTATYAARRTAMRRRARLRWLRSQRAGEGYEPRQPRSRNDVPVTSRIERAGRAAKDEVQAVHEPDRRRAVVGLPQDVGLWVVVVVAGPLDVPARSRIERADSPHPRDIEAVHQPDRGQAIAVLPHDVGHAVVVEVAGAFDLPARARVERA